jgi:hypothetical protein
MIISGEIPVIVNSLATTVLIVGKLLTYRDRWSPQ